MIDASTEVKAWAWAADGWLAVDHLVGCVTSKFDAERQRLSARLDATGFRLESRLKNQTWALGVLIAFNIAV